MAAIIDCKEISDFYLEKIIKELEEIRELRRELGIKKETLAAVKTIEEPGLNAYSNVIKKCAEKLEIKYTNMLTPMPDIAIRAANNFADGIILLKPLREGFSEKELTELIDMDKDIEGVTSKNLGLLFKYLKTDERGNKYIVPATAKAVIKTLAYYDLISETPEENMDKQLLAVILNDSYTVGRPLAEMLRNLKITSVECGIQTNKKDIEKLIKRCDLLISALPKDFGYIRAGKLGERTRAIIDVSWQGNLGSEQDYKRVMEKTDFITPYKGRRIGAVTTAILFQNFCYALRRSI